MIAKKGKYLMLILPLLAVAYCDRAADIPRLLLPPEAGERPRVVLSSPSEAATAVSPETGIFVEFNVPMEEEKTANAFSLSGTAPAPGRVRWEGQRLNFDLESPLKPGESYVLTVRSGAVSREGINLDLDYIVHFIVGTRIDAPRVVTVLPADNSQAVDPDSDIRLVFTRAMDRVAVENAMQISPSVSGVYKWDADGGAFTFTPYSPLQNGTTYSITLGTVAVDLEGIALDSSFHSSFQVGLDFIFPTIEAVYEQGNPDPIADNSSGVFKDCAFIIHFSEAMDYGSVESNFSVIRLLNGATISGLFEWNTLFTTLTFTPAQPLEPQNDFRLEVGNGAKDQAGNTLAAPYRLQFRVDNSKGAVNSEYLRIVSMQKTSPVPEFLFALSPDDVNILALPSSSGSGGVSMTLKVLFSHSLKPGSVPENIFISRLQGTGSVAAIENVRLETTALPGDTLILEIGNVGDNLYELEFTGNRGGILSEERFGESETWLEDSVRIYIRVMDI